MKIAQFLDPTPAPLESNTTEFIQLDANRNVKIHIIDDDTQAAALAVAATQAQNSTLQSFREENNINLFALDEKLNSIISIFLNLDVWSNSVDGYVSALSSDQETNAGGNIKSIRIVYPGSQTIFFQIHNKLTATAFSNSTIVGMGWKLSDVQNDLVIGFEAALQCRDGIAWALSTTQFTYTASSEIAYVFMQYNSGL